MTATQFADGFLTDEIRARSLAYDGNPARLVKLMRRAQAGEELNVCFLGGSITQGSLSSTPETCYAHLVYDWFVKKFVNARFNYVNAGIGGTTSQFGAARLADDVLEYAPDFCMVEFSVNDSANSFFCETYEGVIRQIFMSESKPAMLIMNNLFYDTGASTQSYHNEIGRAYDITCISIRDAVRPEIAEGRLERTEVSPDGLHPNDNGHAILAGLVADYLESIYRKYIVQNCEVPEETSVPEPVTANAMQQLVRVSNSAAGVEYRGFKPDGHRQEDIRDIFSNGWEASDVGDSIVYTFTGSELAIQYRKTIRRPAPIAWAILDGDEDHPIVLDANFDEDWGDSLHLDTLLYHGVRVNPKLIYGADNEELLSLSEKTPARSEHTVEVRIVETHPDDKTPFYLTAFII